MPVILINPFVVEPSHETEFLAAWTRTAAVFADEPGFVDTQLHRSIDPKARFRFINIAHWSTSDNWRDAMKRYPPQEKGRLGVEANPALYTPVSDGSIDATAKTRDAEDSINTIEHGMAAAYRANDAGFLDRVLMDDYIVTDGPGTTSDKAKVLADHRDRRLTVTAFVFDAIEVQLLSPDAAIVTGKYHWIAAYDGHPISGAFRYLRVYARDGARGWRVRVGQVTPVLERHP